MVSSDFLENSYHGEPAAEQGDRLKPHPTDGTTTCYRYCTAYIVATGTPVTLVLTYGRDDEQEADDHITPSGHRVGRKYSRQSAVSGR